jgi:hypothetical protein
MNITEAIMTLHKLKASFINAIYFMSPSLRPSEEDQTEKAHKLGE